MPIGDRKCRALSPERCIRTSSNACASQRRDDEEYPLRRPFPSTPPEASNAQPYQALINPSRLANAAASVRFAV